MASIRDSGRPKSGVSCTQGFSFTALLLVVLFLASAVQMVPARFLPGWAQSESTAVSAFWPQGWNFFANEPSGDLTVMFSVDSSGRLAVANQLQLSPASDWGLNRSKLAQAVEMENLSDQIPTGEWLGCALVTPSECETMALRQHAVDDPDRSRYPTLCGHHLIVTASPLRWTGDTRLWMNQWKILTIVNAEITCAG